MFSPHLLPLLYIHRPGAVYRPHVDGAWPGSGVDPETKEYVFDAYGDRWSRLTFLVYLNDGFEGGCTTYYTPSECFCLFVWGLLFVMKEGGVQ